MEPRWIDDARALDELTRELADEPALAIDTEFHGERTYWPRLALVQIAWSDGLALVDPLAVDVAPLGAVLERTTMVAHASDQDLAILERACGAVPAQLFDTQVAAGFVGMGTPSLLSLAERLLGVTITKGDRLTDWTRRPLGPGPRAYAAADVEHLLALRDLLVPQLTEAGRLEWALDECEIRRARDRTRPDPETAWWKLKSSRQLRGKSRGIAQEVTAWRERTAEANDQPPRLVLPDLGLAGVIARAPTTRDELADIRGLDGRHLRDGAAREILDAVRAGAELPASALRLPDSDHLDRALAPAATVLGAWVAQRAGELGIEASLLGTRNDVTDLLRDGSGRLSVGWRADLVGGPLTRLLHGHAALRFEDGGRRLVLEDR
ncbi:MAG TPA: HRDC domain-containing protein [Acidimicrobiia bacterium]|nr:HRDC domain-containing protein [Acidimicrobiia bacterium]